MITEFLTSWPLFYNAYLSGWLIAILLSLLGVLVVARDQIFIGAAVSQASALGIAVGMVVGSWMTLEEHSWWRSSVFHSLMGGVFSVLAALITARSGKAAGQESPEAVSGWIFLLSLSVSVLLLTHSPHGLEEVHRILTSTIIGAREADVWIFLVLTLTTLLVLTLYHRQALLIVMDPEMARAVGVHVDRWNAAFSVWLGVTVGFSIRVSGVIYAFACLVLPALAAKHLGREVHTLFFTAPLLACGTGVVAFVFANHYDYPPGQTATAGLCAVLLGVWILRFCRLRAARS
ncbi:MAG TPA: iron chelate uptake ABC transporter family permease subunit [Methylomirabilota bacterium]|nr:iron chelate uptake ABC transporter family permease subunit [Methylomirabilota bacterium]